MTVIGLPLLLFNEVGHIPELVTSNILELNDIGKINSAVGERKYESWTVRDNRV